MIPSREFEVNGIVLKSIALALQEIGVRSFFSLLLYFGAESLQASASKRCPRKKE